MQTPIRIDGLGHTVGSAIVSNVELARSISLNDDWFIRRTGIVERHVCGDGEDVLTLAEGESGAPAERQCRARRDRRGDGDHPHPERIHPADTAVGDRFGGATGAGWMSGRGNRRRLHGADPRAGDRRPDAGRRPV